MRSIWKGAISFGLVTIPVKLYAATDQRSISFHQVHRADAGRVRYRRVCEVCGNEISYGDMAKGYELPSGEMVVLTDEDFAELPLSTSRSIDVLQFVPMDQVDPIHFAKSYYLEPDRQGAKPYVLLREALEQSGKVAIVKIALRQRESLATLRARNGVFVLETMLWPDEIRSADFDFLGEDIEVRSQELQMATSLIDTMSDDFKPDQYHDEYREALQSVIDAKVEGREVVQPEEPSEGKAPVVDLMSALQESVEAAREGRASRQATGGDSGGPSEPSGRSTKAGRSGKSRTSSGKGSGRRSGSGSSDSATPSDSSESDESAKTSSSSGKKQSSEKKPSSSRKKSA